MSLLLGVLAALLQAIGALGQKQRIESCRRAIEAQRGPTPFGGVLGAATRDPLWIGGALCGFAGGLLGLQVLAEIDLALSKAIGKLQLLFIVLGGTWLLRERLGRREWLAVATMLAGTLALAVAGPSSTGLVASSRANVGFVAATGALVGLLAWAHRRWPERAAAEIVFALAAGALFGAGDVLMKGATGTVVQSRGAFDLLDPASLVALLHASPFLLSLPAYVGGLVLVQMAFSAGRASLVGPLVAIGATVLPIGFGFVVLQEQAGPLRTAGVGLLLAGSAVLVFAGREARERRAYA